GARAERRQVGAGAGLGVALTPYLFRGQDLRKVPAALLLRAVMDERRTDHLDAHHPDEARRPGAHHLLVDDRLAHDVGALTAVLARPGEREVSGLVDLPLPRLRALESARIAPFHRALVALALRNVAREPRPDLALERHLLGSIREIHRRRR